MWKDIVSRELGGKSTSVKSDTSKYYYFSDYRIRKRKVDLWGLCYKVLPTLQHQGSSGEMYVCHTPFIKRVILFSSTESVIWKRIYEALLLLFFPLGTYYNFFTQKVKGWTKLASQVRLSCSSGQKRNTFSSTESAFWWIFEIFLCRIRLSTITPT